MTTKIGSQQKQSPEDNTGGGRTNTSASRGNQNPNLPSKPSSKLDRVHKLARARCDLVHTVMETPPVSLRFPSGSFSDPQTGAPERQARRLLPAPARVRVPLDAAVTPCDAYTLDRWSSKLDLVLAL